MTGGGLAANTTSLILNNPNIINCRASGGGAINAQGDLTVNGGNLSGNYSHNHGGAILANAKLTLNNAVVIDSNRANNEYGGGVWSAGEMVINNAIISNNTASGNGGGVFVSSSSITINGGQIRDNTAGDNGGGVYLHLNGTVTIHGGEISGNRATTYSGGGVFSQNILLMDGGSISGNVAKVTGGGIAVSSPMPNSEIRISGGRITDNTTGESGGGIFADADCPVDLSGSVEVSYNRTTMNTGFSGGGGVSALKFTMSGGSLVHNHSADSGGGFFHYYDVGAVFNLSGGIIADNTAFTGGGVRAYVADISGGSILNNRADGQAGGLFLDYGAHLTMTGGNISYNQSTYAGGGISTWFTNVIMDIQNGSLTHNLAGTDGGAINVESLSQLTVGLGVVFSDNQAATGNYITDPTDIALHGLNIFTTSFSEAPLGAANFSYAYNNFDVTYTSGTLITFNTVTFETNSLETPVFDLIAVTGVLLPAQNISRTGYILEGWYHEPTFDTAWSFASDTVSGDMTLHARWSPVVYTITFDPANGEVVQTINGAYGDLLTAPMEPVWIGRQFQGWYASTLPQRPWNFQTDTVTGDVTLTAKWQLNQYTVTFDSAGGSPVPTATVGYGEGITEPTGVVRNGFTLDGWTALPPNESGNLWNFTADVVTGNLTLQALWTALPTESETSSVTDTSTTSEVITSSATSETGVGSSGGGSGGITPTTSPGTGRTGEVDGALLYGAFGLLAAGSIALLTVQFRRRKGNISK